MTLLHAPTHHASGHPVSGHNPAPAIHVAASATPFQAGRFSLDGGRDEGVVRDISLTQAPLKPSTEMLTAGARAGGVSVETAWAIYVAMLNATHG